jgi:hypothetical protein
MLPEKMVKYDPETIHRTDAIIEHGIIPVREIGSIEIRQFPSAERIGKPAESMIPFNEDNSIFFIMNLQFSDYFSDDQIGPFYLCNISMVKRLLGCSIGEKLPICII